ncbi:MAG: lipocalin family protein [Bacteroidota bacterium]
MTGIKIKHLIGMLFLGVILHACGIVEVDSPIDGGDGNGGDGPGDVINVSEIDVTDSTAFANELHNESSKTWAATGFTLAGLNGFLDCRLDDTMTLSADGTYSFDGGDVLCGAEDNQRNREGTWTISFSNGTLTFDEGTVNEVTAEVIGLRTDTVALQGQYIGLEIRGEYISN